MREKKRKWRDGEIEKEKPRIATSLLHLDKFAYASRELCVGAARDRLGRCRRGWWWRQWRWGFLRCCVNGWLPQWWGQKAEARGGRKGWSGIIEWWSADNEKKKIIMMWKKDGMENKKRKCWWGKIKKKRIERRSDDDAGNEKGKTISRREEL